MLLDKDRPNRLSAVRSLLVAGLVSLQFVVAFAADREQTSKAAAKSGPPAGPAAAILHGAILHGFVKDDTGKPLTGVRVRIAIPAADMREVNISTGERLEEAKTNAQGEYRLTITGINQPTTVFLDAMKPGFRRLVGTFMAGGDPKSVAIAPGKSVEASLTLTERALYVRGLIVDELAQPIRGVQVETTDVTPQAIGCVERTASNSDGVFELFNFPLTPESYDEDPTKGNPGKVTISRGVIAFSHPDYVANEIADIYVLPEKQRGALLIVLKTGRKLAGTLLDVIGKPVSNGMVRAVRHDGTHRKATLSAADGTFVLRGLADGPTTLWAHREGLKQTSRSPIDIRGDQAGVTLRLQPIPLPRDVKTYSVLGMQLVDLTPELKSAYDVYADCGALILDPGKDFGNRSLRPLREGFCFILVGDKGVRNVRDFVNEIVSAAATQRSDFSTIKVDYEFNSVEFDGNMGQQLILSKEDLKSLRGLSAEFMKDEQDAISALQKAGARVRFTNAADAANAIRGNKEPGIGFVILGRQWNGGEAGLRKIATLSTVTALYVADSARVGDAALAALRKAAPGLYVERVPGPWLGVESDRSQQKDGVHLKSVAADSPAARAGLRAGDVLREFAGKPVPDFQTLQSLLRPLKPGQKVDAKVLREKKTITLSVELGEWN
jgi:PDZ domain/Carboxypeptidase regulatory-like domain